MAVFANQSFRLEALYLLALKIKTQTFTANKINHEVNYAMSYWNIVKNYVLCLSVNWAISKKCSHHKEAS